MLGREGNRHDGETDEERVAKVQRGHCGILVAEFILGPDAAFALGAVHRVDEAEAAGFFANVAGDVGVGEEARGHAGPEGEDAEGEEVARGHCAAPGCIESCACGTTGCFAYGLVVQR